MEVILKSIGWKELYLDTIKRLTLFKNGFRECFNQDEISDEDLEKTVVLSFGRYGQEMVYPIYCKIDKELKEGITMGEVVKNFIKALKETLSETTVS